MTKRNDFGYYLMEMVALDEWVKYRGYFVEKFLKRMQGHPYASEMSQIFILGLMVMFAKRNGYPGDIRPFLADTEKRIAELSRHKARSESVLTKFYDQFKAHREL